MAFRLSASVDVSLLEVRPGVFGLFLQDYLCLNLYSLFFFPSSNILFISLFLSFRNPALLRFVEEKSN